LKPHIAVITVIGRDHYSAFKSTEAIAAEKEKVVLALPPGGTAVLNRDDPLIRAIGERCTRRIVWFGEGKGADLRLLDARSRWPEPLVLQIAAGDRIYEVRTQLHGVHMATPVLAALGVAMAADVPLEEAVRAIGTVRPPEGRMQVVAGKGEVVFIRDDLKAPAWSLDASLRFLKDANAGRKVAVVGTVSDVSGDRTRNYKRFCRNVRECADLAVFVGPNAHRAVRARENEGDTSVQGFSDLRQAAVYLRRELRKGDLVLLKGSHKADHLGRLFLDRIRPIQCWRDRCDKVIFCGACPKLYHHGAEVPVAEPMPLQSGVPVFAVVGLGNPGRMFRHTLHNVGCRVLDALVRDAGASWKVGPEGSVSEIALGRTRLHLLKPEADMNRNGAMVRRFLERIGSDPEHCFIVHDDADLNLGDVRFKTDGGDAGHRGVGSVIAALGTGRFKRVRVGVRRAGDASRAGRFVLRKISSREDKILVEALVKAAHIIGDHLQNMPDGETVPAKMKNA